MWWHFPLHVIIQLFPELHGAKCSSSFFFSSSNNGTTFAVYHYDRVSPAVVQRPSRACENHDNGLNLPDRRVWDWT